MQDISMYMPVKAHQMSWPERNPDTLDAGQIHPHTVAFLFDLSSSATSYLVQPNFDKKERRTRSLRALAQRMRSLASG
jgi:hypothetical protein